MPSYPSQYDSTAKSTIKTNITKRIVITATLTLCLIVIWVIIYQISNVLLTTVVPISPTPDTQMFTSTNPIPGTLPVIGLLNSTQIPILQLSLIILFIYSLFLAIITLTTLFVSNLLLRLIPILLLPLVLFIYIPNLTQFIVTYFITVLNQFLFTTIVTSDLRLYKNFSLSRIILPHTAHIFMGLSLVLVLPTFFYLHMHPKAISELLQIRIIEPITQQVISKTIPNIQIPLVNQDSVSTSNISKFPESIPEQFKNVINTELLNKLQTDFDPQATISATSAVAVNESKLVPNLNELISTSYLNPEQIQTQVSQQVTNQVNQILTPVYPYLSYLVSLAVLLIIFQMVSLLRPVVFIITWALFKICLLLKIASITTENEPVEILKV